MKTKTIVRKGIKIILVVGSIYFLTELAYQAGKGDMLGVLLRSADNSEAVLNGFDGTECSGVKKARVAVIKNTAKLVMNLKD